MKMTPKSRFPLYEHSPTFGWFDVNRLLAMTPLQLRQDEAIASVERFARNLNRIATAMRGHGNWKTGFELIQHERPYCIERRDGRYLLMDRGYTPMVPWFEFTTDDIARLMLPEWYASKQSWIGWKPDVYPIIDDGFSPRWIPQAAGLVQRIAHSLRAKFELATAAVAPQTTKGVDHVHPPV